MFYFHVWNQNIDGDMVTAIAFVPIDYWQNNKKVKFQLDNIEQQALKPLLDKYSLLELMEGIYEHSDRLTADELSTALNSELLLHWNSVFADYIEHYIDEDYDEDLTINDSNTVPVESVPILTSEQIAQSKSVAELFGLPEDAEIPIQTKQTLRQRLYDNELYKDAKKWSPDLRQTILAGEQILDTIDPLVQDQFLSLFQEKPEMVPDEEIIASHRINKMFMEECMKSKDYNELSESCTYDTLCSMVGAEILATNTLKYIEAKKRKAQRKKERQNQKGQTPNYGFDDLLNDVNELNKTEQQLQDMIGGINALDSVIQAATAPDIDQNNPDNLPQMSPEDIDNLQGSRGNMYLDAEAATQLAETLAKKVKDNTPKPKPSKRVVEKAVQAAKDEVHEVQELIQVWGFESDDSNVRISMASKRKALDRLRKSKKLKDLSNLIGQFKRLAQEEQRRKSKDGAVNIKSVQNGNDLVNVLPSEKMLLGNGTTKKDFMRRYHQKELLQYEVEAQNPMGKGPIITCVDISGSMDNVKDDWAKAVALALADIAQKQKRDFACILFNTDIKGAYTIEKGEFDPNMLIDIAETAPIGGTDFEAPLNKALEIITKDKFKKADIVFITDGECSVSSAFLKKFQRVKEDKEFLVRSVLINVGGYASDSSLKKFSDSIATVSSLADMAGDEARKIFQAV